MVCETRDERNEEHSRQKASNKAVVTTEGVGASLHAWPSRCVNKMKKEFGYAFGNLITVMLASIAVVVLIEITKGSSPWFYAIAMGPTLFGAIYMLARVRTDEETIQIDFALPFRKTKRINHEEVEFYGPLKGTNGKGRAFKLEGIYPKTNKAHNQSGEARK